MVRGIKGLSLPTARPTAMENAVLVNSGATLFEPTAVLFLRDVSLVVPEVFFLEADIGLVAELSVHFVQRNSRTYGEAICISNPDRSLASMIPLPKCRMIRHNSRHAAF